MSQARKPKASVLCFVVCCTLLSTAVAPTTAGAHGSFEGDGQSLSPSISPENFSLLATSVNDLKSPTFRAFLRMRLLSWTQLERPAGREAALAVATDAVTDLCGHQDDIGRLTATLYFESLSRSIKRLDAASADSILAKCVLKSDEKDPQAARDMGDAMKALKDPAMQAAGIEAAKKAIMTGQVPDSNILGDLLMTQSNPPVFAELLAATLSADERQPGAISLKLLPFFSAMFLKETNPIGLRQGFILQAVKRSRLQPEELGDPVKRAQVTDLLKAIILATSKIAPALYPEVASRLNLLSPGADNVAREHQAVEERIKNSSDPLEQTISEAEATSDSTYKTVLLERAARLALKNQQLRKAVDFALRAYAEPANQALYLDKFLGTVLAEALKEKQPDVAQYTISKMVTALNKATAYRLLGEYFTQLGDRVKSKAALNESFKQLRATEDNADKAKSALALAQSFLEVDLNNSYDAFELAVMAINHLGPPEQDKERQYYLSLTPVAERLIEAFRLWSVKDDARAVSVAQEIKLPELRVSALSGAYSKPATALKTKNPE
jgi:hypothetical protein